MAVRRLEHYNIRTTKFAETVKFYDDVLGMKAQRAPMAPADGPATWIYDESGVAAIHLTPECVAGGDLARVRDGDAIRLDSVAGTLDALVPEETWRRREPARADLAANGYGFGRELFASFRSVALDAEAGASSCTAS